MYNTFGIIKLTFVGSSKNEWVPNVVFAHSIMASMLCCTIDTTITKVFRRKTGFESVCGGWVDDNEWMLTQNTQTLRRLRNSVQTT